MPSRSDVIRNQHRLREAERFWVSPDEWPFDAPGHVFAARALDRLGRLKFGAEWPQRIEDVRRSPLLNVVSGDIREHCAFGRLKSYLQRADGRFVAIAAQAWNTADYRAWFQDQFRAPATVVPQNWNPFAEIPRWWIFIGQEELDHLANGSAGNDASPLVKSLTEAFLSAPPSRSSDIPEDPLDTRKLPGTVPAMERTVATAQAFLKRNDFPLLTKDEAEKILRDLHMGSRENRRAAITKCRIEAAKRRTQLDLRNRSNQLDDCRRFLTAAT